MGVNEPPFRFGFAVPDELYIDEPIPEGKTVLDGEVVPNPLLERLRAALDGDPRWILERVVPLHSDRDARRQHLIVWVSIPDLIDAGLEQAQGDVQQIVVDVVPGAWLIDIDRTSL
jgi:hypothetical protein